jgi:hypothetical protein
MSNGGGSLQPTFQGHVNSTHDALLLFEACLTGTLSHVPRRPHDRERNQLVRSGCVFIYEENASGIKRWTDGVPWSPSRILGNFLVYRELLKPFPPGEKKRATKRNKRPQRPGEPYSRSADGNGSGYSPETPSTPNIGREESADKELERSLIGSLVDSYGFREQGLVKKTMSVSVQGVQHHLVSYYKVEDVKAGRLRTPSMDDRLQHLKPRYDLIHKQNFRVPLADEMEEMGGAHPDGSRPPYVYGQDPRDNRQILNPQPYPPHATNPSGYYPSMEGIPYPNAHQQPGPVSSQYSHSNPSHSYYQQPPSAPQIQQRSEEFSGYGTSQAYPPRFEPFGATGGLPNPTRSGSQPQPPAQTMPFPHSSVQRSNPPESPIEQPYSGRTYYSSGAPPPQLQGYDQPRRHTQPSPSTTNVRESQPQPGGGYQNPNDRQMWMNGTIPVGQGQYSGSPPVSTQWSSSMA